MKRGIILLVLALATLAALLAGAWMGPRLAEDPGYVLIEIGQWRIRMSLLVLVLAVLGTWLVASLIVALVRMPGRAARKMREARERRNLERGLLALSEGDWATAEKALARGLRGPSAPTVGYLAAARAAQGQSASERRDLYLEQADRRFGHRHFVTLLARARMLLDDDQAEPAIETLEHLHLKKPAHKGVLKLLLQAYQQEERWHDVRLLIPAIRRAGIVPSERATELESLAAARELGTSRDPSELLRHYGALKKGLRHRNEVVVAFASRAIELDRAELAETELRRAINAEPDDELLTLYAQSDSSDHDARIRQCEQWLKSRPRDARLHLALGRLYLNARRDEDAAKHLEIAVREVADPGAYAALGQVMDRAGRLELATRCYRNALRLEQGRAPDPLPLPAAPEPAPKPANSAGQE